MVGHGCQPPILASRERAALDRRKPKQKTIGRSERDVRKIAEIIEILAPYTDVATLSDLYQRGEESGQVDGFPAGSSASSIYSSRGVNRPVERMVELLAGGRFDPISEMALTDDSWQQQRDYLMDRLTRFQSNISELHGTARELRKCASVVLHAADQHRGRQSSLVGDCLRCSHTVSGVGSDRMRSGLCHSCSNTFYEERSPGQSVASWLGNIHPLANRRPAPVATAEDFTPGMTYTA